MTSTRVAAVLLALAFLPGGHSSARPAPQAPSPAHPLPPMVAGGGIEAPVTLPIEEDVDGTPQLSRDGKRLAFAARVGGRHQIVIADRDGTNARRISDGRCDDLDPAFGPDGWIYFSCNARGNRDIWRMKADGSQRRQLTSAPEDERWPRPSPIEFQLEPFNPHGGSAWSDRAQPLTYHRVLFQRGAGAASAVWSMLDDGRFPVRVSPEGMAAAHPAWSPDGLWLAFDAGPEGARELVLGIGHTVDRRCREGACAVFLASDAIVTAEQALQAPKDWYTYDLKIVKGTRGLRMPAFFANRTALVAVRPHGEGAAELVAVDFEGGATVPLARDVREHTGAAFSPLGTELVYAAAGKKGALRAAASRFYLSEALNLYLYPELVRARPAKLAANRFVVVPGTDREYSDVLERARKARKGVFVSTDAAVQLASDLVEATTARAEREWTSTLRDLLQGVLARALRERQGAPAVRAKALDAIAFHVAVPLALLSEVKVTTEQPRPGAGRVAIEPVSADQAVASLALPEAMQKQVRRAVARATAASEVAQGVDYTRFRPRGHYADGGVLAAWFRAVSWLQSVPLGTVEEPLPWLEAWRLVREQGLEDRWERLDAGFTALAGPPQDPSYRDLAAVDAKDSGRGTSEADAQERMRAVLALRPANRIAGMPIAQARSPEDGRRLATKKQLFFFPQRASPDAAWLQALTTPAVEGRAFPDPLDVLSVLGSDRARALVGQRELQGEKASRYAGAYRRALERLAPEGKRLAELGDPPDLASAWLRVVALLASRPQPVAGHAPPAFTRSDAWADKALASSVAAYTVYKHATVLYAMQPGVATAAPPRNDLAFWRERPLERAPRGYVEPNPAAYAALASLMRQLNALAPRGIDRGSGAAELFERLQALSEKELAGVTLSPEEYAWIELAGVEIARFDGGHEGYGAIGRPTDRAQRGVKLVTDVFTNRDEGKVLEVATGDVSTLYVVTPHGDEQLLTQGGACSVYVFTWPMSRRLTDEEWGRLVDSGKAPAPVPWTRSFVEALR